MVHSITKNKKNKQSYKDMLLLLSFIWGNLISSLDAFINLNQYYQTHHLVICIFVVDGYKLPVPMMWMAYNKPM